MADPKILSSRPDNRGNVIVLLSDGVRPRVSVTIPVSRYHTLSREEFVALFELGLNQAKPTSDGE